MSPLSLHKAPHDRPRVQESVGAIKAWTRTALGLSSEVMLSVSELACHVPGCPPQETVVLVLRPGKPPQKLSIHKALVEVTEADVTSGWGALPPTEP